MERINGIQLKFWGNTPVKPVIIIIGGKAGVGKTTTANILKNYFAEGMHTSAIYPLAKGVKDCCRQYFGWDGKKDERGRKLLQLVGTEIGRWYNEDNWVNFLIKTLNTDGFPEVTIIDDWRFPNEYLRLAEFPFLQVIPIKILAPNREILKGTPEYFHPSEISLDDFNIEDTIDNTGSMEQLEEKIIDLIERRIEYA